jgi:hypothetical protein
LTFQVEGRWRDGELEAGRFLTIPQGAEVLATSEAQINA